MPGGLTTFGTAGTNVSFYSLVGNTSGSGGSGTVTSISAGSGMSFATITTTGTVAIDVLKVPYISGGFSTGLLKWNGSNWTFDNTSYYPASNPSGFTAGGGSGLKNGITSGVDTYTTTISGVSSYADGDAYLIRFISGNTTSCTLNINSLGAISLYRNNDGALIGGDIIDGAEMLCVYNSTSNVFQCIGTAPNTLLAYVTNAESTTITKGQPVYVYGGTGDRITVKLAYNTSDATSAQTIGVVQSTSIAANQKGLIIIQGQLDNLSLFPTSTWADGDYIYLGATAGTITNVKPSAPNHLVYLGYVTTASNGNAGRMYVKVQNGYELDEIHNVKLSGVTNNDILAYESATSLWKNKPISGVLGYVPQAQLSGTGVVKSTAGTISYISGTSAQYIAGDGSLISFPSIPTVGTWAALNYPTWTTGTPFVKMTAAGTFALDTNTYLTGISSADVTTALGYTPFGGTNPLPVANGGTGISSVTNGDVFYATGGTIAKLAIGTSGQTLASNGTLPVWSTVSAGMTNPMTTLGDIIYGAASGTATRLAGNTTTTQKFLGQVGTGTISAAPTWFDLFGTANTFSGRQTFSSSSGLLFSYNGGSTNIHMQSYINTNANGNFSQWVSTNSASTVYYSAVRQLLAGSGNGFGMISLAVNTTATGTSLTPYFTCDGQWGTVATFVKTQIGATASTNGILSSAAKSTLDVLGSFSAAITTKTSTYTATISDYTILCNATTGAITINLPTAVGIAGREYIIKKTDASANAITVDGNGSETIDGSLTYSLASQYKYVTIQTDGANWFVIGNN